MYASQREEVTWYRASHLPEAAEEAERIRTMQRPGMFTVARARQTGGKVGSETP